MLADPRKCRFFWRLIYGVSGYIVHCLPCMRNCVTVTAVPREVALQVICIQELSRYAGTADVKERPADWLCAGSDICLCGRSVEILLPLRQRYLPSDGSAEFAVFTSINKWLDGLIPGG